jgi:CO/xanthine dehydrogenase FAD-binding subunit
VKPEPASGSSGPSKSAAISADLMTIWKEYYRATSITDALHALAAAQGPARVIAGGTDILLDLQQERLTPLDRLVDVNSISEMQQIEIRDGQLTIGAAVPLSRVVAHPLVREHAQALVEAGSLIGGPQVRNQATLGGNVAHALPAADGSIALLAQGALAEIASLEDRRLVPIQTVYAGPGRSALRTGLELLVEFSLPLRGPGEGAAFRRVMRPQGVALPVLNLAAWLRRDGERVEDLRIAIGPAGPVPFRAVETEAVLRGKRYEPDLIEQAIDCLQSEAGFRTSPHRATKDYRTHLAAVLLAEVFAAAWERAAERR